MPSDLKKVSRIAWVMGVFLSVSSAAFATPTLQLDILGGYYVGGIEETIFASGDSFTLYAFLKPDRSNTLLDQYFISAALVPKTGPVGANLGSFAFGTQSVQVTEDMSYGIPPLESYLPPDRGDLAGHGIFETYFQEFSFSFDSSNRSVVYDTQDHAGQGPVMPAAGAPLMYYQAFTVDTSNLAQGYSIHFDLYNEKIKSCGPDIDISEFAPFSHDAQSPDGHTVPEPGSLTLLAAGVLAAALAYHRQRR